MRVRRKIISTKCEITSVMNCIKLKTKEAEKYYMKIKIIQKELGIY